MKPYHRITPILLAQASLLLAGCTEAGESTSLDPATEYPHLLTLVETSRLSAGQHQLVSQYQGLRGVGVTYIAELTDDPVRLLRVGQGIRLSVSPATHLIVFGEEVTERVPGYVNFSGRYQTDSETIGNVVPSSWVVLTLSSRGIDGFVMANRDDVLAAYEIVPIGDGLHLIFHTDFDDLPVRRLPGGRVVPR